MKYFVIGTYREDNTRPDSPIAGFVLATPYLGHSAYPVLALQSLADQGLLWARVGSDEVMVVIRWNEERRCFEVPAVLERLLVFEPRAQSEGVFYYEPRLSG